MYISQILYPHFLSKSDEHITVKIGKTIIIGVNFNPEKELDDIIVQLGEIFEAPEIEKIQKYC